MSDNSSAYITLGNYGALVTFESMCSTELRNMIRSESWLKWEKLPNDKGKEIWHLIVDLTDEGDKNERGQNRLQRLVEAFIDDGLILFFRRNSSEDFDSDYKKYVFPNHA